MTLPPRSLSFSAHVVVFPLAGKVTDSQLFAFNIPHTGTRVRLPLVPKNGKGELCLVDQSGRLGPGACETTNANGPDVRPFFFFFFWELSATIVLAGADAMSMQVFTIG